MNNHNPTPFSVLMEVADGQTLSPAPCVETARRIIDDHVQRQRAELRLIAKRHSSDYARDKGPRLREYGVHRASGVCIWGEVR